MVNCSRKNIPEGFKMIYMNPYNYSFDKILSLDEHGLGKKVIEKGCEGKMTLLLNECREVFAIGNENFPKEGVRGKLHKLRDYVEGRGPMFNIGDLQFSLCDLRVLYT